MDGNNSLQKKIAETHTVASDDYPDRTPLPGNIMVELTNACNLRCPMCYNRSMQRSRGFMSTELYQRIVEEVSQLGLQNLGLYTTGEALLHPRLFEFIRAAKTLKIDYVYLSSNGLLLDEAAIDQVLESGLDSIKFSIDAATPETYRRERPGGEWEKLLAALRKLRRRRDQIGSSLKIYGSYIITENNFQELALYRELFADILDETSFAFGNSQAGYREELAAERFPPPLSDLIKEFYLPSGVTNPCGYLWNRLIVTYDGKLTICCADFEAKLLYGDLHSQSLAECWNGAAMQRFRKIHREGDWELLPNCAVCDMPRIDYQKHDQLLQELLSEGIVS